MTVIVWLEYELAYYDSAVHRFKPLHHEDIPSSNWDEDCNLCRLAISFCVNVFFIIATLNTIIKPSYPFVKTLELINVVLILTLSDLPLGISYKNFPSQINSQPYCIPGKMNLLIALKILTHEVQLNFPFPARKRTSCHVTFTIIDLHIWNFTLLDLTLNCIDCLFGFHGTSTFVGYLMPNPFYTKTVLFQSIQFSKSTQFSCQKSFFFKLLSLVKRY